MSMKATVHFEAQRIKRGIETAWVERMLTGIVHKEVQPDGRHRLWGFMPEIGKYVRVVVLEDGETLHTIYPDRDFEKRYRQR